MPQPLRKGSYLLLNPTTQPFLQKKSNIYWDGQSKIRNFFKIPSDTKFFLEISEILNLPYTKFLFTKSSLSNTKLPMFCHDKTSLLGTLYRDRSISMVLWPGTVAIEIGYTTISMTVANFFLCQELSYSTKQLHICPTLPNKLIKILLWRPVVWSKLVIEM